LLSSYDVVILDPGFKGSITAVARSSARVCAYLSLGEIRKSDRFFSEIDRATLLGENPAWPGTYRIDVRRESWKNLLLGRILPWIAENGFTGVLLDTLDTPPYLEQLDPKRNHGMKHAATDLLEAIRRSRQDMFLIMNRGYAIVSDVLNSIDCILIESLLTCAGSDGSYRWNPPSEVALQLSLLAPVRHRRPHLPILSLDYWSPDDIESVREIYYHERLLGHYPYVATRKLDEIFPEPPRQASRVPTTSLAVVGL
jgi:polysaccharide biosynthesis protein PelA